MKIAILGAMAEEIAPILDRFGDYSCVEYGNNRYYQASYAGHDLMVAHSKVGKVFAALTASTLIQHFGAERLLFSGVAGGVADGIKINDLILATKTVQHDVDISAFGYDYGQVPDSCVEIETDQRLNAIAKAIAQSLSIDLKQGIIATGDQFVHSEKQRDLVSARFSASAVEMEGASVNLVCHELGIPCLILRSISDSADGQAVDDFSLFVKTAAERSASFILAMLEKL